MLTCSWLLLCLCLAYMWTLNVPWINNKWKITMRFQFFHLLSSVLSGTSFQWMSVDFRVSYTLSRCFFLYAFQGQVFLHPGSTPINFLLVLMINYFPEVCPFWVLRMVLSSSHLGTLSAMKQTFHSVFSWMRAHPRWAPFRSCVGWYLRGARALQTRWIEYLLRSTSDGCVWWVAARFLASPQFLAGFHLIRISRNEIESCPASLQESQMLWTDGDHKARQSPYANNASQPLPPQLFTCGNQTSQDETQSSITSCPVVSWKCFILLNTEKRGTDGKQGRYWLPQRKSTNTGEGRLPIFSFGTDLPFLNDRHRGGSSYLCSGLYGIGWITSCVLKISFLGFVIVTFFQILALD